MPCVVIVGAQWGDEGKGKVVDLYTEVADWVVRYAGGPNAGHTLVVGDEKLVVRLLPSGILRKKAQCVLGQGMVIDPGVLLAEIDELARRGHGDVADRLAVSDCAHLILPYHVQVDALREAHSRFALGTTKRGIGPAYEDKVRRIGIRTGMLRHWERLRVQVEIAIESWSPHLLALGATVPSVDSVLDGLAQVAPRLIPMLKNTAALVDTAVRGGQRVMLEGAQGTLLDVDHGTYPYVTSSTAVSSGAAVGVGIGPNRIDTVLGITKAYTTRVGAGPFRTELNDSTGEQLRRVGAEFGSVTGRPRRTGWLDLPALRYAARINGFDGIALTKLDVLTGLSKVRLCVGYDTPAGRTQDFILDDLDPAHTVEPVYKDFDGWGANLAEIRTLEALPKNARAYLDFIVEQAGVPLYMVGVGARRDETIILRRPFN